MYICYIRQWWVFPKLDKALRVSGMGEVAILDMVASESLTKKVTIESKVPEQAGHGGSHV